jgi:methyl-accepting chemotaxis protein
MLNKTMNVRSIRTKLLLMSLSIVAVAVVCTAYFSIRATVGPLRGVVNESMTSLVDEFYTFVEANPDMDWALIKEMCNEQITIGKTGFIFVMDPEGNMLIHKEAEGENWGDKAHIKEILERKNGHLRYLSPETKTYKLAAFRFFEEWNWIIVASAFEDDFMAAPRSRIMKYSSIAGATIVLLAAIIIFLYAVHMSKPILMVVAGLRDIAEGEGDLTRRLEVKSKDEVGELAKWFNLFLEKIQGIIANIAEDADTLNKSSTSLSDLSNRMSTSADNMSAKSNMVAAAAEEMSSNIISVASSMEEASSNVGAVATSAEEMTATINEIAENSEKARTITGCLLYTSPSPRDRQKSRMPSSA